jgi:hypothetical protein
VKATSILTTLLLLGAVVVGLSPWLGLRQGGTAPETPSPTPVEGGREPARIDDAPATSTVPARPAAAPPEDPAAIAAQVPDHPAVPEDAQWLPAESMLQIDGALGLHCAMQVMTGERFADAVQALSDDAASEVAAMDMRAAIAEVYREAYALAGGGAEIAALACGLRFCMIEARLPADKAEDEIRAAFLGRLLGNVSGASLSIEMASEDGGSRIMRRVFSVSPAVSRVDRVSTSCT